MYVPFRALHREMKKKAKKGESLNRLKLQRMEALDVQNWTPWRVRLSASFCARVLFRDGPYQGHVHANRP